MSIYSLLADLVLLIHLAFVGFALFGGLLALRSRCWLFLHLPSLCWAALVEFRGWICPLTPLENHFRRLAFQEGYGGGFIEHYLLPLLYPEGLTRDVQLLLGTVVLAINLAIYLWVFFRRLPSELRHRLITLPNLLSLLRLLLAPVLLLLATLGFGKAFVWVLAVALATDALDGWLARQLGQRTELGAKLDSWGDLLVFAITPLAVWRLWPVVVMQELLWLVVAVLAIVVPLLVGLSKFRRITSYHTYGAKLAAVLLACGTLALLFGLAQWPFRFSVMVLLLAEIEEIGITMVLPRWQADVPTILHALRLRRKEA